METVFLGRVMVRSSLSSKSINWQGYIFEISGLVSRFPEGCDMAVELQNIMV